ncbi:MFS transporter [Tepidiforma flava]|uniref:MFS transporter n=1 Tax=Tepidiforma flava TaxID=3004094 RepID=A0ABY7M426_9CHLR|nr:MFS transporter [Tepidiforma flava]WBL34864.1 MFS transporter [Tepidiforma flava]
MPAEAPRARFFYGWVVVGAVFGALFVAFGAAYSFAAFFNALRDEFGATRSDISLVFALSGFLYFGLGAVTGLLADRLGPRRVIAAGIVCIAAGMAAASLAQAVWQVYLTYSLGVGVGVGLVYVPAVGVVQRWFIRRRGMASGFAVAGIGAGTLVMPLLAAASIDALGWRPSWVILAAVALVIGIPAVLTIVPNPADRGLYPDGDRQPPPALGPAGGPAVRQAIRSAPFWLLFGAGLSTSLGIFIPFAHLTPYARDQGYSDAFGALLIGFIGIGSIAGRLLLGSSADRLGRRRSLAGTFVAMGLCLAWWLTAVQAWALILFALAFGAAYGGFVALIPALAADYFAGRSFGAILGLIYTSAAVGALAGPTLAGALYDARESYDLPIMLGIALNGVAVLCTLILRDPAPVPRPAAAPAAR